MKNKVFITRKILPDAIDLLQNHGIHVDINNSESPLSYEELVARAKNYDAIITMLSDRIDQNFLEKNSHLKVISNYAVGFNNIDIATANRFKIPIGNTPDVLTDATAEVAMGLMISAARNFNSAHLEATLGLWKDWNPAGHLGHSLFNKTLGIIGMGRIGLKMAQMCKNAFNMKILYTAQTIKSNTLDAKKVELEILLKESDFISIHAPLTAQTKNLIGKKELNLMKNTAVLINTARGEIIDQEALIKALKEHKIFAAGLDVTSPEPLSSDSELFKLKNAFILPHIGSASFEARKAMSIMCAKNIIAGLVGDRLESQVNSY